MLKRPNSPNNLSILAHEVRCMVSPQLLFSEGINTRSIVVQVSRRYQALISRKIEVASLVDAGQATPPPPPKLLIG